VAAYERAQRLRQKGSLVDARAALVTCAQPSCPAAAVADCVPWLAEVEQSLPSVVLEARDASGHELVDVHVLLDGNPFVSALDGKAVALDPGVHTFHYELASGEAVEERVSIRTGEKNRTMRVTFGVPHVAASATPVGSGAPEANASSRPVPPLAWALGGLGAAGLIVFTAVGATSLANESTLRSTCAPHCAESDVHAIRVKHTIADVGLSVGVVSLGVAAALFFTRATVPKRAAMSPVASPDGLEWTF
jgi:hypothetical protein